MEGFKFSTIEEAVADLRAGKMIIAVDDRIVKMRAI